MDARWVYHEKNTFSTAQRPLHHTTHAQLMGGAGMASRTSGTPRASPAPWRAIPRVSNARAPKTIYLARILELRPGSISSGGNASEGTHVTYTLSTSSSGQERAG